MLDSLVFTGYSKMFVVREIDTFTPVRERATLSITKVLREVETECPPSLAVNARNRTNLVKGDVKGSITSIIEMGKQLAQGQQKTISRGIVPFVKAALADGYESAKAEKGRGCMKRQKKVFEAYVVQHKRRVFDGAVVNAVATLDDAIDAVAAAMRDYFIALARKVFWTVPCFKAS